MIAFSEGEAFVLTLRSGSDRSAAATHGDGVIRSPMPGRIASIAVTRGESVSAGQALVVLEAMKMEHALVAPFDGAVAEIEVAEGDQVSENVALIRLDPAS